MYIFGATTRNFAMNLDRLPHLQQVSLELIENQIGNWSDKDGFPGDTLRQGFGESDASSILHLFRFITNASAAAIHLPDTLVQNWEVQEMQRY